MALKGFFCTNENLKSVVDICKEPLLSQSFV